MWHDTASHCAKPAHCLLRTSFHTHYVPLHCAAGGSDGRSTTSTSRCPRGSITLAQLGAVCRACGMCGSELGAGKGWRSAGVIVQLDPSLSSLRYGFCRDRGAMPCIHACLYHFLCHHVGDTGPSKILIIRACLNGLRPHITPKYYGENLK